MEEDKPVKMFLAYSREDSSILEELRIHLKILERTQNLEVWFDGLIEAGSEWEKSILNNLLQADIILLLISQNFIASDYCYNKEMREAIRLHGAGKIKVIPIISKECLWEDPPFAKLQALPLEGKPIISSAWETPNRPYLQIVNGIKEAISGILNTRKRGELNLDTGVEPKLIIQKIDFKYNVNNRKNQLLIFNGHPQPVYVEMMYLKHQSITFRGPTFMINEIVPANSIKEIISPPLRNDETSQEHWEFPGNDDRFWAGIVQTTNTNWSKQEIGWENKKWENGTPVYVNAIVVYLIGTKRLVASTIVWQFRVLRTRTLSEICNDNAKWFEFFCIADSTGKDEPILNRIEKINLPIITILSYGYHQIKTVCKNSGCRTPDVNASVKRSYNGKNQWKRSGERYKSFNQ